MFLPAKMSSKWISSIPYHPVSFKRFKENPENTEFFIVLAVITSLNNAARSKWDPSDNEPPSFSKGT